MAKKLYFRIGEACKELEIPPYVLRYWETEFAALKPEKSKAGQRVYSEDTLAVIRRIKDLLYNEGYTIAGAKKRLEKELNDGDVSVPSPEKTEPKPAAMIAPKRPSEPAARAAEMAPDAETQASSMVDTEASNRLKMIKAGVQEALASARELRDLLT